MTARRSSRAAAAFVLLILAAGSIALWVGVPVAAMWLAGELTDSFGWHMPLAMAIAVPGIILFAAGLAWLDDLYLRVSGGRTQAGPDGRPVRRRGPLEPLLIGALLLAIAAFALWFFIWAENPDLRVW